MLRIGEHTRLACGSLRLATTNFSHDRAVHPKFVLSRQQHQHPRRARSPEEAETRHLASKSTDNPRSAWPRQSPMDFEECNEIFPEDRIRIESADQTILFPKLVRLSFEVC